MSRSFHANRKQIERMARHVGPSAWVAEQVAELADQVESKRLAKQRERARREKSNDAIPFVDPDTIPIRVEDESAFVHYPAGSEDLRALMRSLPPGFLSGIREIVLRLGVDTMAAFADEEVERETKEDGAGDPRDPYTGRHGHEGLAGVWSPSVLGVFRWSTQKVDDVIHLFAYVYPADLPRRSMWELYLRARMLSTFVHELAHFRDCWSRRIAGPHATPGSGRDEDTAERFAARAFGRYVLPCLELRYPDDCAELRSWLREQLGQDVPLNLLMEGSWFTDSQGSLFRRRSGGLGTAVGELSIAVREGHPVRDRRRAFADRAHDLHFEARALPMYEELLAENPDDVPTLEKLVCALDDLGRHEEAIRQSRDLLERSPSSLAGHRNLRCSLMAMGRFDELLLELDGPHVDPAWDEKELTYRRVVAWLGLSRLDEAARGIERLERWEGNGQRFRGMGFALRCCLLLRRGELQPLLRITIPGRRGAREVQSVRLIRLVLFDAAHRSGRPDLAPRLTPAWINRLRGMGWHEWFDALEKKCAVPAV